VKRGKTEQGRPVELAWDRSCNGYSLLEMLIGSSIIFTLLAIAAANGASLLDFYKLFVATSDLVNEMQAARMYAVTRNSRIELRVDSERGSYQLVEFQSRPISTVKYLPKGVKLISAPRRSITFYSRGNTAPAGSITLGSAAGARKITVSPGGRVRTERLDP
jgi:hypothetical protein